ncbi:hypothetical protein ACQPZZ_37680 [Microbispora sp. CA-135349]|uniref:hypothetical protein n=1 Tax=Microbispora sp. CA-135349 TaxID=3239953 RepID=UPI003D8AF22E
MAEDLRDDPGVHALSEQDRGAGVPEVVQPYAPDARRVAHGPEVPVEVLRLFGGPDVSTVIAGDAAVEQRPGRGG